MDKVTRQESLDFHSEGRPGKIEVVPTVPYFSQRDLSLAYSPGVAWPCREIAGNPDEVYRYTVKGNLVAVISNGTAVLGLGDIGPMASKPVMEGKALLFKIFAGIDCFDIEIDETNPARLAETIARLAPTFGGINLEDIKAPECFEVEDRLKAVLDIPVMHDDQHGTAIITAAAMINALELQHKRIERVRIVVNGAGAAAVACARLLIRIGVDPDNMVMCDSHGVVRADRTDLNPQKREFATRRDIHTLADAMNGADVFLGLSAKDVVSPAMLRSMAPRPAIFALANPDPEIDYETAMATRDDLIMATGRSDYPNQINNVLGFPYIFRGALDTRATAINEEMKIAAVHAIARLAHSPSPADVCRAYGVESLTFGPDYILPKALDPRLLTTVSPAVAKAAIDSGVATRIIADWTLYRHSLQSLIGRDLAAIKSLTDSAIRQMA